MHIISFLFHNNNSATKDFTYNFRQSLLFIITLNVNQFFSNVGERDHQECNK